MTAVEWLVEQIIKEKGLVDLDIQAAIEMEKQQIIDAHLAGQNSAEEVDGETEIEYYNETYKKP